MTDAQTTTAAAQRSNTGAKTRVVVAMSGGVDSSVAAALMKAAGHDVIGVTLQLYDHGTATGRKGSCCAGQDIHDARRVADALGIPHYVLDYEARFAAKVIESFAESYVAGETPIPCVTCNNEIKFRDLLETAKDLGAEVLVTGHYVQRRDTAHGPELARAADPDRDQSYFLFGITKEQLATLVVPDRRHAQSASARAGALVRSSRRRQVRQSGHLLRADGALYRRHRAAEAERARFGQHRPPRRSRPRPPRRHRSLHGRSAARHQNSSRRSPLRRAARCGARTRSWSARARR